MNVKEETLINEIELHLNEIINTKSCLIVYKQIIGKTQREIDLEKINQAPAFFRIVLYALRYSIIMGVSKMYDSNKDAKTIKKLIERCKTDKKYFSKQRKDTEKIEDIFEDLEKKFLNLKVQEHMKPIKELRDKTYAHNDAKYFAGKFDIPKVPVENVEKLLNFADMACNKLLNRLSNTSISTNVVGVDDLDGLLSIINIRDPLELK